MDTSKYLINKIGACRNCVRDCRGLSDYNEYDECEKCNALICSKHSKNTYICKLCQHIPKDCDICIICDNPAIRNTNYVDDWSSIMAFSESYVSLATVLYVCDYCKINHLTPLIYPNTDINYQSYSDIMDEHGGVWIGGPSYELFSKGNEINYQLIYTCREKILTHYKNTVHIFILDDIARIIIEYCGFARDIVFVPCK